jgi:hypothetical protein
LTGAAFTGPLHFVQFWIDEIKEWQKETGKDATIALSTTKDVQDAILSDAARASVVDVIDIRYWYYKDNGSIYAPEGGKNLAPRQHARLMKVGNATFDDVYHSVSEYRKKYPDKPVTYFAQNYPQMAWAVFMAGGSLPYLPHIDDPMFLKDALQMKSDQESNYYKLENENLGAIFYLKKNSDNLVVTLSPGLYRLKSIDVNTGKVSVLQNRLKIKNLFSLNLYKDKAKLFWFERLDKTK